MAQRLGLAVLFAACGASSPPSATSAPPVRITPRPAPTLLDSALEKVQVHSIEWLHPPTTQQRVSSRDVAELAEQIRQAASQTLAQNAKPGEVRVTVMCTPGAQDLMPSGVDEVSMAAFREKLATIRKLPVQSGYVMLVVRLAIQPW
jgi:hypothetical protein